MKRFLAFSRLRTCLSLVFILGLLPSLLSVPANAETLPAVQPTPVTDDLMITGARVHYEADLDLLIFEQTVQGQAGRTLPTPRGGQHGAPVLAYVFPTTLAPESVGFGGVEGIVALAATSHPDFDDTPLWDENGDSDFANDGLTWHTHWVVLGKDARVPGGLSVLEYDKADATAIILPPTNPGMPLYLDSPGHPVVTSGARLRLLVPASRIRSDRNFKFDAVSAYMEVNTDDPERPTLGVYEVYSVLSGDLSLPYSVD